MSQRTRIHAALLAAVAGCVSFYTVAYSAAGVAMSLGANEAPASVRANEIASSFIEGRNRRDFAQDRGTWRWKLYLDFNSEVSLEGFEDSLCAAPLSLARDGSLRPVTLKLIDVTYQHPVQHESASGTSAVYTFEASQSPL